MLETWVKAELLPSVCEGLGSDASSALTVCWCTAVILAPGKWRREGQKVLLSCVVGLTILVYLRPVFKNKFVAAVLCKWEMNLCFIQGG